MSETANRGYPVPDPDSPPLVRQHISELADAIDVDVAALEKHSNDSDMQVKQDVMEYVRHEIHDLETDLTNGLAEAKAYTDAEIAKLESRLNAKIDALPTPEDTSQLPVLGPWAISPTEVEEVDPGVISGDYFGTTGADYRDLRKWNLLIVSLLDSTYHSDNRWENLRPDWVITYNGPIHSVTWKCLSAATRNGDQSLSVNIEWVDGTTTDPADLGSDGYIFAHPESSPHFPI